MPTPVTAASFRAGTAEHRLVLERTPEGRWRVLDVAPAGTIVVDTLCGYDDRLAQAQALADDYVAEQQAYHDGVRDSDPLPRPQHQTGEERTWAA